MATLIQNSSRYMRKFVRDYKGMFKLVDAWEEITNGRKVFKFKLELLDQA